MCLTGNICRTHKSKKATWIPYERRGNNLTKVKRKHKIYRNNTMGESLGRDGCGGMQDLRREKGNISINEGCMYKLWWNLLLFKQRRERRREMGEKIVNRPNYTSHKYHRLLNKSSSTRCRTASYVLFILAILLCCPSKLPDQLLLLEIPDTCILSYWKIKLKWVWGLLPDS